MRGIYGYIYVLKSENTPDIYKIGHSKYKTERINKLRNLLVPYDLITEFVIKMPINNVKLVENYLHNKFKTKKIRGEWFKLSPKDIISIKTAYKKNIVKI